MLDRLEHRGPDDGGEVRVKGSWLGHRRLSIVDVESGRQPLVTEDRELWLVGNVALAQLVEEPLELGPLTAGATRGL